MHSGEKSAAWSMASRCSASERIGCQEQGSSSTTVVKGQYVSDVGEGWGMSIEIGMREVKTKVKYRNWKIGQIIKISI